VQPGTRLGSYDIVAPLGAGGMGEVYRARDPKLNRDVAIKILPEALATDPVALARFEREAQAVAALSHPNVLAIFDFGRQGETAYAVMELLEGETLRARLGHGALSARKAAELATQIAEGLAAAHGKGIVHRDLKPENIFVTSEGLAKILDFGVAKRTGAAGDPGANLETSLAHTDPGMVLGTAGYMSPEQVRGEVVDHRSDIFSFGVVLYEMLTGQRAFGRGTAAESMAAILKEDPPELATTTGGSGPSPALQRIVQHCLEKKPGERFQSARDVAFALGAFSGSSSGSGAAAASAAAAGLGILSGRLAWLIVGALIVSAAAGAIWWRSPKPVPETMHFSAPFAIAARDIAAAPNGHTVAVVGYRESARKNVIWLYEVGSPEAKSLADTEGASFPFWSPDGKFLAFFADGKLKKIEAAGGPVQTLCDAASGRGGSWSSDGVIIFTPSGQLGTGLLRIPAAGGGTSTPISTPDARRGENTHRWPVFLPDGKHYLYLAANVRGGSEVDGIYIGLLDSNEKRFVVKTSMNVAYAAGYLFFYRDKTLLAQRFDLKTFELSGEPTAVLKEIQNVPRINRLVFSVSENGRLFAQKNSEASLSRLTWFDRDGKEVGVVGTPDVFSNVALAPNGRSVAVDKTDNGSQNTDLWTYDLQPHSSPKQFTFDSAIDAMPVWSPTGDRLLFTSSRQQVFKLYMRNADGAQGETLVVPTDTDCFPNDWSRDGKHVLYGRGRDLWLLTFPELTTSLFLKAPATLKNGQFSPNGKWVAYASNESGKWEVYVTSFPGAQGPWRVSTGGGEQPRWAGNGREIFFLADGKLMAAPVSTDAAFDHGTPVALFDVNPREILAASEQVVYDVDRTGQRFLINTQVKKTETQPFSIVLNWDAGLKK
jgi:Tol biopolymer transport system component/tRNA A-37 threonylcarbamoyl transferase component Bud32